MKSYRKVLFVVLALLPLFPLLLYAVVNFAYGDLRYVELGSVAFTETQDGLILVCEADTWADRLLMPLFGSEPLTGVFEALGRLCNWLALNAGVPVSVPLVFAVYYFVTEFILWVLEWIFDLISFVPRKCLEVFR